MRRIATLALIFGLLAAPTAVMGGSRVDLLNQQLAPGASNTYNTGTQIRSIQIDNHSGSFLRVSTTGDYVPPYTIGWSRDFIVAAASVDVTSAVGPQGQQVTTNGTNSIVSLFDHPIGNNVGQPIIATVQPVQQSSTGLLLLFNAGDPAGTSMTVNVLNGVAGKSIVITGVDLIAPDNDQDPGLATDQVLVTTLASYVGTYPGSSVLGFADLNVSQKTPADHLDFASPFALPVGRGISVTAEKALAGECNGQIRIRYYLA